MRTSGKACGSVFWGMFGDMFRCVGFDDFTEHQENEQVGGGRRAVKRLLIAQKAAEEARQMIGSVDPAMLRNAEDVRARSNTHGAARKENEVEPVERQVPRVGLEAPVGASGPQQQGFACPYCEGSVLLSQAKYATMDEDQFVRAQDSSGMLSLSTRDEETAVAGPEGERKGKLEKRGDRGHLYMHLVGIVPLFYPLVIL